MKLTFAWYGGPSYAAPSGTDVEHASSLRAIKAIMESRENNFDGRTPCVESSEALVWRGHLTDTADVYPDLRLYFGPRGGIRVEPC